VTCRLTAFFLAFALSVSVIFAKLSTPAWAAQSESMDTGKVVASLISDHDAVEPGAQFKVALRTVLDVHWHTYWRNPGDSGEPVQIDWVLPDTVGLSGDLYWPLPDTIATGPIINYGFEGVPLFVQTFQLSEAAVPGSSVTIDANVYYLVCKDVCIPEQTSLSLSLEVGPTVVDARWDSAIKIAIAESPKAGGLTGRIRRNNDALTVEFSDLPEGIDTDGSYFFPFRQGVLMHSQPQTVSVTAEGLRLMTGSDYLWDDFLQDPDSAPKTLSGVLSFVRDGVRVGSEVRLTVGDNTVDTSPTGAGNDAGQNSGAPGGGGAGLPAVNLSGSNITGNNPAGLTLWSALIGAFIGGVILNLMPCVFPVISIKALSIAKSAHGERAAIRRQAWLYTFGVIATFMALTILLLGFKAGGSQIGWGFQLQSPKVVAALAVLLFVIGLNLLGVFEIGSRLQNTGSGLAQKPNGMGSFFTGALAVVVATPCTAPFMAGAVGYALGQPAVLTVLIFMALALGFALPFLLIAYVPGLISRLPKPGPWMVRFREILAFPMFGAAIWLVWVLSLQSGADGVLFVLCAMLAFALAIWFFKQRQMVSKVLGTAALLMALILPVSISVTSVALTTPSGNLDAGSQSWSPERIAALRAEGRTVFVDFTAAWCVTCQVNKTLVLDKTDVKQMFIDTDTVMLVADWTNKDDRIAQELARHGRSGVPLYLLYPPGQISVRPAILPQVLSKSVLQTAIAEARSGSGDRSGK